MLTYSSANRWLYGVALVLSVCTVLAVPAVAQEGDGSAEVVPMEPDAGAPGDAPPMEGMNDDAATLQQVLQELKTVNQRLSGIAERVDGLETQVSMMQPAAAGLSPNVAGVADTAASKIHVLIASDSNDAGIGPGAMQNAIQVKRLMDYVGTCKVDGVPVSQRMNVKTLVGNAFSFRRIQNEINGFSVGPNDTLMLYVSCHGGFDREHFFGMERNVLRRDVWQLLANQNARQTILISDSCANRSSVGTAGLEYMAPVTAAVAPLPLAKLLLFHDDPVNINGCNVGEFGIYLESGGLATHSFFEAALTASDAKGWQSILDAMRVGTQSDINRLRQQAGGTLIVDGHLITTQTPSSFH